MGCELPLVTVEVVVLVVVIVVIVGVVAEVGDQQK